MESSITIQTKHIFGCKGDIANAVYHIDEHRVIYASGHNIVIYNIEDRQMQFLPGLEGSLGITAVSLCPKRRFLAVAERAERAIIFVYDLQKQRKKRALVTSDCLSQEYISMSFAPKLEKKYLISLGGQPDWTLIYWQWDRQRVLYSTKVSSGSPVYQVSFNILDYTNGIIVTGNNVFLFYKPIEGLNKIQTQGIAKKEPHVSNNYLCHSWLYDGKLVIGTDAGEILLCDQNCEYRGYLTSGMESWSVLCILPYSNGFLVGGEEARVVMFERNPEDLRMHYGRSQKSISVTNQPTAKIKGMSISPNSEDSLILALDNSQIYNLPFTSEQDEAKPLSDLFHTNAITGLDVCIRKPLIATCGIDNSVRIWNYEKNNLEVIEFFTEEPYSIAFHPSGFHIVVGFADKLRMMNIFATTIKHYKEIHIKVCKEIKFCNGGHMFAAANGHEVQVFNFYTGENPPNMKFRKHIAKVTSLHWNDDDSLLYSAGADGAVYEWKINVRPEMQNEDPDFSASKDSNSFECIAVSPNTECRAYYLTGKSNDIKEIVNNVVKNSEKNETEIKQALRTLETGVTIKQIAITHNGKFLVAGVSEAEKPGALRIYKFDSFNGEYSEIQAHSLPVVRIRITYDDTFIFSAGQDGSLIIYEIRDKDFRSLKREKEGNSLTFAEEILITKSEIEELNHEIENLKTAARELETNSKMHYDMELQDKQRQIEELKQQIYQGAQQEKQRYDSLFKSKREMETTYEERLISIKNQFNQEKEELNRNFAIKLKKEEERFEELKKEREYKAKDAAERIERLKSEHTRMMAEREEKYRKQYEEVRIEIEMLAKENEDQQRDFESKRQRLEEINERDLFELREQNIQEIKGIKTDCDTADAELSLARKVEEGLKETKNKKVEEVKQMDDELENQRDKITNQNGDLKSNEKEITVRKTTIKEKEKRIFELKKKKQELEKFRFVLDYKIRELKRDIGPREDEIIRLKEQTSEMEKELKHLESVNEKLGILVENLRLRQDGMQEEIKKQSEKLIENNARIQALKDGIYDAVQYIQDEKKLKEAVLKLYEKFVRNETQAKGSTTENQYVRQCEHLERTISGLRKKLKKVNKVHQQDTGRIMSNNVDLISEINGLRKELKYLNYLKKQIDILSQQKGGKKAIIEDVAKKEMEMQKEEILVLRRRLNELETGVPQAFKGPEDISVT